MSPDLLLRIEQFHVLQLLIWSATSVLTGGAVLPILYLGRSQSPLIARFGLSTAGWGVVEFLIAAWWWHTIIPRDLAGATMLDRLMWLAAGLDVGIIAVGATLAAAGWWLGRRLGAVGGGLATVVQGAALFAIHTRLLLAISSLG